MVVDCEKDLESEEQIAHYVNALIFDTSRLKRKKAEAFWSLMKKWDWSKDRELFWLSIFNPDDEKVDLPKEAVFSSDIKDRFHLLFELLSKLFPGLTAVAQLKYGSSQVL